MFANFESKTIEMNKTEAREAGKYGSEAFKELQALRTAYPTFRIEIKATKSKGTMKGLTYASMEAYIETHDKDGSIMAEFKTLRGISGDTKADEFTGAASYGEIRMWFLDKFPEIEGFNDKINGIVEAAKKSRAAKKAA